MTPVLEYVTPTLVVPEIVAVNVELEVAPCHVTSLAADIMEV